MRSKPSDTDVDILVLTVVSRIVRFKHKTLVEVLSSCFFHLKLI